MRPLLVLVHGSLFNAEEWSGYAQLLPNCDVVAVDLPGHGTRTRAPFTTSAAIQVINEAVAKKRPGQLVVLAGHSLGGYMAAAYAARYPEALDGLVLIGASGDPRSPLAAVYRAYAWLVGRVSHDTLAKVRNTVAQLMGVKNEQLPDASAYAVLPQAWQAVIDDCPRELMSDISCPVLFINGQFDQMRVNERAYQRLVPGSRRVIIPRASHLAPLTHPRHVARFLDEFIATLPRTDTPGQH